MWGHDATRCHFLAMYAYVSKYWKKLDPEVYKANMAHWKEKNQRWLDNDKTPKRVSALYCENARCNMDTVTDQIDWDFFDIPSDRTENAQG